MTLRTGVFHAGPSGSWGLWLRRPLPPAPCWSGPGDWQGRSGWNCRLEPSACCRSSGLCLVFSVVENEAAVDIRVRVSAVGGRSWLPVRRGGAGSPSHWQPVWGPRLHSVFLMGPVGRVVTPHCALSCLPPTASPLPCSRPGLPLGETALRAFRAFACGPSCVLPSVELAPPSLVCGSRALLPGCGFCPPEQEFHRAGV